MGADFKAFQTYMDIGWDDNSSYLSIPRNGEGPTKNYFLFNVASSTFGEAQRQLNIAALTRHMAEVPNNFMEQLPVFRMLGTGKTAVESFVDATVANPHALTFMPAAVAPKDGIGFVDQRVTDELATRIFPHLPPEQQAFFTKATRHHEAAHLMLEMGEAGSDFVSSVLMLRDHPESRDFLRANADARLLKGIAEGEIDYKKYGAECHDAIEHALSLSPEKIRSLSLAEIHAIGKTYDDRNERNEKMDFSPEADARERLSSPLNSSDIKRGLQRVWNHATGNLPAVDEIVHDISKGNFAELGKKLFENPVPTRGELRKLFQNEIIGTNTMQDSLSRITPDHTTEAGRIVEDVREALGRRNERTTSLPAMTQ